MSDDNKTADVSQALTGMFKTAGGFLLAALVITIFIEMGLDQAVPVAVYVIMAILLLGIFAFYAANIFAMIRTNETRIYKKVEYRNPELEALTALSFQEALARQTVTTPYTVDAKPVLVKQKTLRKRAPQIAPTGTYPAIEHDDSDDDEPLTLPANVTRLHGDDDEPA